MLALALAVPLTAIAHAEEALVNPVLGQPEAIAAGHEIYGSKCYVCHHSTGARGPNSFATKLTDEQFLEVVINGRKGTQMPAFGLRLSPDEGEVTHSSSQPTTTEHPPRDLLPGGRKMWCAGRYGCIPPWNGPHLTLLPLRRLSRVQAMALINEVNVAEILPRGHC